MVGRMNRQSLQLCFLVYMVEIVLVNNSLDAFELLVPTFRLYT